MQIAGYGYIPLAPNPPDSAALRRAVGADANERYARATCVLVRHAATRKTLRRKRSSLHVLFLPVGILRWKLVFLRCARFSVHGAWLHVATILLPIAPSSAVQLSAMSLRIWSRAPFLHIVLPRRSRQFC